MPDDNYIDATNDVTEATVGGEPMRVVRTYASDFAAASGQPQAVRVAPPPQPPTAPSPAPIPPQEAPPQEDRAAILARLRAKADMTKQSEPQVEEQQPAPVFNVTEESRDIPRVPPVGRTADRLIEASPLVVPDAFVPPPPIEPPATARERITDASAGLHTYKSDFAGHIEEKGASATSVLAAQSDAPRQEVRAEPVKRSSVLFVVFGIAVVLLGAGAVYGAYGYLKSTNIVPAAPTAPSLIFVDDRQEIKGTGSTLFASLVNAANAPLADGAVRLTYVTNGTTTAPESGDVLVSELQLPAPDILLRSVQPATTVGVVHAGDEQRAFFILRVDSYERSFAGMLAWEETMAQDLSSLYPAYPAPVTLVAAAPVPTASTTTTSTSTSKNAQSTIVVKTTTIAAAPPPTLITPTAPSGFRDEVIDSHDVRVLRDAYGRSVIMYGYWNQTTLIIARDESAFTELVNRLATTRQQ